MRRLLGLTAAAMLLANSAQAEFPERNIENIYPWGPGATMAASQVIADAMGEELGVNISVVSTPGAAGTKAFRTALDKPADGYTIFDGYVAPLVLQPMFDNADWTYEDFTPLWSATSNSFAIVVREGDDRFPDFPALVDYMKENPGDLRYSPGVADALPHMVAAKVMQTSDVVGQVVPYPEIDNAIKDLRGGVLDFMVINPGVYAANKDDVRVLAVLSELEGASETYDGAPRVQDFGIELGMTGLAPMGWNWWLVRKETPDDVVAKLREAMGAALARDEVNQRLLDMGYVPLGYGPDQYEEIVAPVASDLKSGIDAIAWEKEKLQETQ
ncbi:tripartite tricarboxylate transporter substrate-binding protein [Psychromarinibacter sp. C21-152]|uniref:Tripartite tricarboxylate transporter substrate-binding protein n=1 Tax=Psychromarinibacter sediminicola TaxID=3033385 RepID=A0AAE3T786_9RHOB|nr:tripartite tricarboxylate transporter substrate-binding protein [Psychromarinibacter sediminicola]MDF0599378.1 tripartite tricarboxylate transporter substrate-binding protein [Psychromarinibacter sediminicola]